MTFFNKNRAQLLGLFDYLPLSDELEDSNRILLDYRLTVRELQVSYIKNVMTKLLLGEESLGLGPAPISNFYSVTFPNKLGDTLSGESGEINEYLNEILILNEIYQNSINQLAQVRLKPTTMGLEAYGYWQDSGLENIPSSGDLTQFFDNISNMFGLNTSNVDFDFTSLSKIYVQLIIDTQASMNYYYPSMLTQDRENIKAATYVCSDAQGYKGGSAGEFPQLILDMAFPGSGDISNFAHSRLGEYGYMLDAFIDGSTFPEDQGLTDFPLDLNFQNIFKIGNSDEINLAALIQIFSREMVSSQNLYRYQEGISTAPTNVIVNQNSEFSVDPPDFEGTKSFHPRLISATDQGSASDINKGVFWPDIKPIGLDVRARAGGSGVSPDDAGLVNLIKYSHLVPVEFGKSTISITAPYETNDIQIQLSGDTINSGISGLIEPAIYNDLRTTLLADSTTEEVDTYINDISGDVTNIIDNNLEFIKLMTAIDQEDDKTPVGMYGTVIDKLINLFEKISDVTENPQSLYESATTDYTAEAFFGSPELQAAFIIELIKLGASYPGLDRQVSRYFYHYFNAVGDPIELTPDSDDYNYETNSLLYLNGDYTGGDLDIPDEKIKTEFSGATDKKYYLSKGAYLIADELLKISEPQTGAGSVSAFTESGINPFNATSVAGTKDDYITTDVGILDACLTLKRGAGPDVDSTFQWAINKSNYNPFYQMAQFIRDIDSSFLLPNYSRELFVAGTSPAGKRFIKATRRGALDVKAVCMLVYKIFQKAFIMTDVTALNIYNGYANAPKPGTSTGKNKQYDYYNDQRVQVGLKYREYRLAIVDYLESVKDSLRNIDVEINTGSSREIDLSYPGDPPDLVSVKRSDYVSDFVVTRDKLREEELNLRMAIAYFDQFKLEDTANQINRLAFNSPSEIPILRNILSNPNAPEIQLEILNNFNSGQAKLTNLSKSRLLPNLKIPVTTVGETNPESFLPNNEIISSGTFNALLNFMNDPRLKNTAESELRPQNSRILMCGLPSGFIDNLRFPTVYLNSTSGVYKATQNYDENHAIINLSIEKNDLLAQDIVFKPITMTFDTSLIIAPNGFDDCTFDENSPSLLEQILSDKILFQILGKLPGDPNQILTYNEIKSNSRYNQLSSSQLESICLNCATSELLKKYLQIIVGIKLGEENLYINDILKSHFIDGFIGETSLEDLLESMKNISDINLPNIDFSQLLSESLANLLKVPLPSSSIVQENDITVAEIQQASQLLLSALFRNDTLIAECAAPKHFETTIFMIIDPDEFVINEDFNLEVQNQLINIGQAVRGIDGNLRLVRTDDNEINSTNINEYHISCNIAGVKLSESATIFSDVEFNDTSGGSFSTPASSITRPL